AAGSMQIAKAEMENASAEIGAVLLPALAGAAGAVADLAGWFSNLPEPVQNSVLALSGVLAATGPLLTVGGKLVQNWKRVADGSRKPAAGACTARGRIGTLGRVLGGLAIAAVAYALSPMAAAARQADVDVTKAARSTTDELVASFQKLEEFGGGGLDAFRQ